MDQDEATRGRVTADRHRFHVVRRLVPAVGVIGAGELEHDDAPRLPVTLEGLAGAAADQEPPPEGVKRGLTSAAYSW